MSMWRSKQGHLREFGLNCLVLVLSFIFGEFCVNYINRINRCTYSDSVIRFLTDIFQYDFQLIFFIFIKKKTMQKGKLGKLDGKGDSSKKPLHDNSISYSDYKKKAITSTSTDIRSQSINNSFKTAEPQKQFQCQCQSSLKEQLIMSKLDQLAVLIEQKNKKIKELEQFITRISKMALMMDPHQFSQQSSKTCMASNFKFTGLSSHKASLSQQSQQMGSINMGDKPKIKIRDQQFHFKGIVGIGNADISLIQRSKSKSKGNQKIIIDDSGSIQESSQFEIRQPLAILNKACSKSSSDCNFLRNRMSKSSDQAISSLNEYQPSFGEIQIQSSKVTFFQGSENEGQNKNATSHQKANLNDGNIEKYYRLSNNQQYAISRASSKNHFSQHPSFSTIPESQINVEGIVKQLTQYQIKKFNRDNLH